MVQMYKPAYTHLMNPAWMSTFLFLAPAKKKRCKKIQMLAWVKEIIIKLLRSSNRPCEVLQQELELCSQTTV